MDSIKQLILESAEVKFLQHNYDDVFLTEICRDAGITTVAFYRRFSEKRELICMIVDLAMSDLKDGIKEYQAKRNEQFSKERMRENWLSILVYQHRNRFQIMLRHAPVMEKDTYLEEAAAILTDTYGVKKYSFTYIAFKAYFVAPVETLYSMKTVRMQKAT